MVTRMPIGRLARRTLLACALGAAAVSGALLLPADAVAQTTTRPEFLVGTQLTAKKDHVLPVKGLVKPQIKVGTAARITKVNSSNGTIVSVDVTVGTMKAEGVKPDFVRLNYDYPKS